MTDNDDTPMHARGIAGPLGKLISEAKTKIDPITEELWLQHCANINSDTATLLRDFIYATVHKKTYRQMVVDKISHEAKSIDALAKLIGSFEAPESGGNRV
jgi:hypothetical protein